MYGCRPRQSVVWSHSVIAFWWGRFSLREERLVRFQLTDFHSRGSGADEGMGYKVSIRGSAGLRGLRAGFKPWHLVLIVLVIMGTSQPKQSFVSPRALSP